MNEGRNIGPSPEEKERQQEQEDAERLASHFAMHPEQLVTLATQREAGPEIAEFEALVASFEATYSLEALHALTNLTMEESRKHPLREPARVALFPIVAILNTLKKETNISPEKYEELNKKKKCLSMAVGMINNHSGKIDHDR